MTRTGATFDLIAAGARIHQSGCMGCIGMGQAPAAGKNSLRTFPRNFPGRSGTREDSVWLCSPETAASSALTGVIIDPRDLGQSYPELELPEKASVNTAMLVPPLPQEQAEAVELIKGTNISALPDFPPLPDELAAPVLLKAGDNVSTDEISPAGASALPLPRTSRRSPSTRSRDSTPRTPRCAREHPDGHIVIAGQNYGQGSSREHAAIPPRYLGLRVVIAKSFARIPWQNLANFGIVPLEFTDPGDYADIEVDDVLCLDDLRSALPASDEITVRNTTHNRSFQVRHQLSPRQVEAVLAGGVIPLLASRQT